MTRTSLVEQLMARYAVEFVTNVKTAEHLELQRRGEYQCSGCLSQKKWQKL